LRLDMFLAGCSFYLGDHLAAALDSLDPKPHEIYPFSRVPELLY
jgi:hypothetical protein